MTVLLKVKDRFQKNIFIINCVAWFFLLFVSFLSLGLGAGEINISQVWEILWGNKSSDLNYNLILMIRLPRLILVLMVGSALAISGLLTQGLFRNPLATPEVLGLNAGAILMILIAMSIGFSEGSFWIFPLWSFLGVFFVFIFLLILTRGLIHVTPLLLYGISLNTILSALIAILFQLYIHDYNLILKMNHWIMGSFEARSWKHVLWGLPPISLGLFLAFLNKTKMDLLHLGLDTAITLGLNKRSFYLQMICAVALLLGTATCLVGILPFIALIVPQMVQLISGASYRKNMMYTMTLGATFLLFVDMISRIGFYFHLPLLPPGVITSLIGVPFFLYLINRNHKIMIR